MKWHFLVIAVFFAMLIPIIPAQADDFQSVTSHYNQYSQDSYSSSYNLSESQYSAANVSNPYSQTEVQFSAKNVIDPFVQEPHDYKAHLVSPESSAKAKKAAKKSAQDQAAAKFLEGKTRKVPVFFFLLLISSFALAATIFIIIGIFKK